MYNNGEEACYALAVPGSGVTALNLNYEINLFGSCTNIHTTETVFYPVIQDEPTRLKVEKDNGWIGNLIAGVAITALFAGLAIATVATGGAALAAVAFAGAAVGTAAVTAGATYSDIKSGSSRSFGDFAFQLTMGAAVGFMTGASVYGIVAALPAASAAAGVEASLIAGSTSAFTAVAVPGIVTAGGYAVAAGTGVVALNESYAIGSGTNVLLETAFNGDIQAYETTSMMIDLLGMGIVQCGIDNAALGQSNNKSNKKGVYVETSDNYSDTMHKKIKSWANDEAERLSGISKRQREKFNTASIVYDESTGKYYYGKNKGISINNTFKNPILFGDDNSKGILPEKSLNKYIVGNCAEVDAVNNALNDGAKLENLYMSTIHTTNNSFGDLKSACENCTYTFKGKIVENYAGWFEGGN